MIHPRDLDLIARRNDGTVDTRAIAAWVPSSPQPNQQPRAGERRDGSELHHQTPVAVASRRTAALGDRGRFYVGTYGGAAEAVRARPVPVEGERLVVCLDGTAMRLPLELAVHIGGPAWLVPLRSFAGVAS